jgi:hypothetical protein
MTTPFHHDNPDLDDQAEETSPTEEARVRECLCGRDGVTNHGQCAVRDGWGALRPGTYCRRGAEQ